MMSGAFGTDSFEKVVGRPGIITFRQGHWRDMDVVETECTMAFLAVEMHMGILVMGSIMAETKLIPGTFNILDRVDEMMLLENGEATEYPGLVYRSDAFFQLHHAQWPAGIIESPGHQQPVSCSLDSMLLKEVYNLILRHTKQI